MKKKKDNELLNCFDRKPNPIITDPQGCYTGRPIENYETPVQDADDL